jgi:membrane-anchored mycosin MYCP
VIRSLLATVTAAATVALIGCPPAGAIGAPVVDPAVAPPSGDVGPEQPMAQRGDCATTGVLAGSDPAAPNANNRALNLSGARALSRGDGQLVAVIDTGVQPGPRLRNVEPGGDFVESTDGLTDCDGHGTLVAGLIAGQPGDDGFSGVAPGARILSIRQNSARFAPRTPGADPALGRVANDVATLARAIVRAADLGARVITVSMVSCLPADKTVDQAELGAALRYAAVDKDAVIVAAAGDTGGANPTGSACAANTGGWADVTSVSIPSWWQPYVLSVGSLTPDGGPSAFTMTGPWVGIAAPGENITSLSNAGDGGLANGAPNGQQELLPISGTGYAAAYVAGVAALVRSRFPQLPADEVVRRLTATAHGGARSPSDVVGAGSVDPVAALTWEVPADAGQPPTTRRVAAPPAAPPPDHTPRTMAFAGVGALALVVLATAAYRGTRRKDTPA